MEEGKNAEDVKQAKEYLMTSFGTTNHTTYRTKTYLVLTLLFLFATIICFVLHLYFKKTLQNGRFNGLLF